MNIKPYFRRVTPSCVLAFVLMCVCGGALADAGGGADRPAHSSAAANGVGTDAIVYRPPLRGAPGRRVGGASRGDANGGLSLVPLVPDHTGVTVSDQPVLYWYQSDDARARVVVTLIDEEAIHPLVEAEMAGEGGAGIHRFALAEHGAHLKPGVDYEWTVASVPDPSRRSADRVAGGFIRYTPPANGLTLQVRGAAPGEAARIYAANGVWYDALDVLSRSIAQDPGNAVLKSQREALLRQVGLDHPGMATD